MKQFFSEQNSGQKSNDAGALKALDTAPEMTYPASKRPRGAEPLAEDVVVIDPVQVNQGRNEQGNFTVVDKDNEDEYSLLCLMLAR